MKKFGFRRAALACMLAALVFTAGGCVIKPDPTTVDTTGDVVLLPFETSTPIPTLSPTQGAWQPWNGGDSTYTAPIATMNAATDAPAATATIQVITPQPTAKPMWTIQPIATTAVTANIVIATAAPTVDTTLRNGSSGVRVKALQQKLQSLGYYAGSIDGDFGAGTEAAVKAFQSANGLKADGVAGSATQALLDSGAAKHAPSPTATVGYVFATARPTPLSYTPSTLSTYRFLQSGSTGGDVTRLQQRLKDLGYFTGSASGTFTDATKAAVVAFQERNGLWVDGVAGEDTQRMLFSSAALPFSGVVQVTPQPGSASYQTLKKGSSGEAVASLQSRLSELYYYSGAVSGTFDDVTVLAVKVFQQRNGLTVDGVAGSGTQSALYAEAALPAPTAQAGGYSSLKNGSTGEAVYSLQEALYDLGYYTGRIDGVYDDEVTAAVMAFQKANSLTADGKAGNQTQKSLYSGAAKAAAVADATYSTLRAGDTGERVRALQALLASYGYFDPSVITGVYDNATVLAVQQLQAKNGLTVDGVAGPATLMLIYAGAPSGAAAASTQTAAYTTLKQGASGPDVGQMQTYLAELGFYTGVIDGSFGYTTQVAVRAFQSANGLTADGVAGSATLALLYSGDGMAAAYATPSPRPSLRAGDQGADVLALQQRLAALGYLNVVADGVYGSATTNAVIHFQQQNGLTADGVAGASTMTALYAATVVSGTQTQTSLTAVSNRSRELEEQNAGGAIQASLSGGGVAASYGGKLYFLGDNGAVYVGNAYGSGEKLIDLPARFLHASSSGLTFVSGNQIYRAALDGSNVTLVAQAGSIARFSLVNGTMYYLEGSTLMKLPSTGNATVLASGVNDFLIDIYDYRAYLATSSGVLRVGLNGSGLETLVTTAADQVALADTVVLLRSAGAIYRVQDGVSRLLVDAGADWMGVYRDKIYYIAGNCLYRCDTDGANNRVFYDGLTSQVSFAAGKVYISADPSGRLTKVMECE